MSTAGNIVNGYSLDSVIGRGSFGAVYHTQNPETGSPRAIKEVRITPQNSALTKSEASIHERIKKCRHVLNYLPCIELEEFHYFPMQKLEGKTVHELSREKSFTFLQTLLCAKQALEALSDLEELNIAHRDIKPENCHFDPTTNQFKIFDFGLASHGISSIVSGSPGYIAPEVWQNQPSDTSCDLWSLGATLFELFTKQAFILNVSNQSRTLELKCLVHIKGRCGPFQTIYDRVIPSYIPRYKNILEKIKPWRDAVRETVPIKTEADTIICVLESMLQPTNRPGAKETLRLLSPIFDSYILDFKLNLSSQAIRKPLQLRFYDPADPTEPLIHINLQNKWEVNDCLHMKRLTNDQYRVEISDDSGIIVSHEIRLPPGSTYTPPPIESQETHAVNNPSSDKREERQARSSPPRRTSKELPSIDDIWNYGYY